jgi:predicted AlkP superfamily phosphohydrolase/phosphomutase
MFNFQKYFGKRQKRKVMVIGLDCAEPSLLFERWLDQLPHFRELVKGGAYGRLRSCDPPITVPAWSVMTSSQTPGALGIYGFRNRADYSYDKNTIANSTAVKADRVWNILSRNNKRVILIGIPQTFPPSPVNGLMVGDFLTPDTKSEYTYPPELKNEIATVVGDYMLDVRDFRSDNKKAILRDIFEMTEKRFKLATHLLSKEAWDFFMMVEIGVDRIHHAFWAYMDPAHRRYEAGNPFENAILDYYKFVDAKIGELLKFADADTTVLVVSDHGAQCMEGSVCINEWLIQEGYLALLDPAPKAPTPLAKLRVDWSRTRAWGDGGYYSRIFLNVEGREPQGVVKANEYEALRSELIEKLEAMPDEKGKPLGTKVFRPEQLYQVRRGIAPDLLAYFGNLAWRSAGSVGLGSIYTFENDTGPDDANHAQFGIFIAKAAAGTSVKLEGLDIQDVAPTILRLFDLPIPADMEGKVIQAAVQG